MSASTHSRLMDRFAFACGGSNALCCWLRLPKLFISAKILLDGNQTSSMESKGSSSRRKLINLAYTVFSVAHVCACLWFYIGIQYQVSQPFDVLMIHSYCDDEVDCGHSEIREIYSTGSLEEV